MEKDGLTLLFVSPKLDCCLGENSLELYQAGKFTSLDFVLNLFFFVPLWLNHRPTINIYYLSLVSFSYSDILTVFIIFVASSQSP